MKLSELIQNLKLESAYPILHDPEITTGYTSDLLSDVMANAKEGCVLITIQAHKNTVAVAGLVQASAILICNGRNIPEDMIEAAKAEKIALLKIKLNQYQASIQLYQSIKA